MFSMIAVIFLASQVSHQADVTLANNEFCLQESNKIIKLRHPLETESLDHNGDTLQDQYQKSSNSYTGSTILAITRFLNRKQEFKSTSDMQQGTSK